MSNRIDKAIEALVIDPSRAATARRLVEEVLATYRLDRAKHRRARSAKDKDFRTLKQARDAIGKAMELISTPDFRAAYAAGIGRISMRGDTSPEEGLDALAQALQPMMALHLFMDAAAVPLPYDIKEDVPLRKLVQSLGLIYLGARGETGVAVPGYDDGAGMAHESPFLAFLRLCMAAVMGKNTPSDEAIRHRIRKALNMGDLPSLGGTAQNLARARLAPSADAEHTDLVTRSDGVTNDEQETTDRPT